MSRKVQVNGAGINVSDWGAGSPILLLHGNPDSSLMWEEVARQLAGKFLCIAPDLPGFGSSEVPPGFEPSLEGMAEFVEAVRQAIGISTPLDLVAHDFGGPFAFAWAVKYPDVVHRMVAINTMFFSDYRWHFWARVWRTPILGELSMAMMNRVMFGRELKRGSNGHIPESQIDRTWALITPRMKREVLRLYRATNPEALRGWEDKFLALTARKATLVIWGDKDPYISRDYAERFKAKKVVHLPQVGHWPPVEVPDETAEHIGKFLSED